MYTIRTHWLLQEKTIETTTKHPILCSSNNNMWGKTPDNHQQASGTCWEKGGFGWGIYVAKCMKNHKKITEPVTKWVNSKRCGLKTPTFLGVLRVFCHLSLTLEHKIRCFPVISLVFTVKIDAAVVWNLRIYLRFPFNLRTVINPVTMKAGAKLTSPALKIQVCGFPWPQKIFLRTRNVIILSCVWLVKITSLLTSLVWKDVIGVLVSSRSLGGSRNSLEI